MTDEYAVSGLGYFSHSSQHLLLPYTGEITLTNRCH